VTDWKILGTLFEVLYVPAVWNSFINDEAYPLLVVIFQAAKALNISSGGNYTIPSTVITLNPDSPPTTLRSHTFEAVLGADNYLDVENRVVMKDVLTEIVNITRNVSPTCELPVRGSCR
jgi:hypothetical protein